MSWSTGFTKYLEQKEEAEKVISFVEKLNISIGDTVILDGKTDIVKQLWITKLYHENSYEVRVEVVGQEDVLHDLKDLVYGPGVEILYAKD